MCKLKKATVLFGSPHNDGHSSKLLSSFLSGLKNYDVNVIDSYKVGIKPCIDCKHCIQNSKCSLNDFSQIDEFIRLSSLIIIATPVYNLSFPAPLKAIFDRMQLYYSYKVSNKRVIPKNVSKKCILLLTCGKSQHPAIDIIKEQLKLILLPLNSKLDYSITIENTDKNLNYDKKLNEAVNLAKNLSQET